MGDHICPWWLAYAFDNPLRRFIHKPEHIFSPYLQAGMTAVDLGCGMGYFSIGMARIVGATGRVYAVDVQQQMLAILRKRALKAGVAERITPVLCDGNSIGVSSEVDFALAFWMVHETPDQTSFLAQVHSILKGSGRLLVAEPKMHVTRSEFEATVSTALQAGFRQVDTPLIFLSNAALFERT